MAVKIENLSPLYLLQPLRPNGAPYGDPEQIMHTTPRSLMAHANDVRGRIRSDCGWTPTFQLTLILRDRTPWVTRDVSDWVR